MLKSQVIKMRKFNMFITAICVLFLVKLDGPRTKAFMIQVLSGMVKKC